MKVLCCGDRNWDDVETVVNVLSQLPHDTIVIHGACKGADITCGIVAKELGFTVRDYPAQWDVHKRAAGPIRNRQMIKEEHLPEEPIDLVIGFHNDIENSKGTADMLGVSKKNGITTVLITSGDTLEKSVFSEAGSV